MAADVHPVPVTVVVGNRGVPGSRFCSSKPAEFLVRLVGTSELVVTTVCPEIVVVTNCPPIWNGSMGLGEVILGTAGPMAIPAVDAILEKAFMCSFPLGFLSGVDIRPEVTVIGVSVILVAARPPVVTLIIVVTGGPAPPAVAAVDIVVAAMDMVEALPAVVGVVMVIVMGRVVITVGPAPAVVVSVDIVVACCALGSGTVAVPRL